MKYFAIISAILISLAWVAPSVLRIPKLHDKIIGGYPVDIEDFPYQVSLHYYNSYTCGGSIVTPNFVVTAAHCTDGASAHALSIIAGTNTVNQSGVTISIKSIHQNPDYDSYKIDYDISLLELASELQFSAKINKVPLPELNQDIPVGVDAVVSGWGVTEEGGSFSNQLQAVTVRTVSKADCIVAHVPQMITDRMTCAGGPQGGKDSCLGDSGGPLMLGGQLIGIVSWGRGCGRPKYPGVYGNVPILRDFITSIAGV